MKPIVYKLSLGLCVWIVLLCSQSYNQISYSQSCSLPQPFDAGAQYTQTLYVSPDGTNGQEAGGEDNPLRTLQAALERAQAGTKIVLLPGRHQPGAFIQNLKGTKQAPILITGRSAQPSAVISGGRTALQLSDPEYVVLQNFTVEGASANGINIDDGGDFSTPARHVILRDLQVRDIGTGGNQDGIKLSGVNHFLVERCRIERAGGGGSGIDMVGCHDGVIAFNDFFENGSNSIQAKGGSSRVLIYANRFEDGGLRAINMGGSTGLAFFRPSDAPFEASRITVVANVIRGSQAPIAFVGTQFGLFTHNVIDRPGKWAARILQETTGERFVPSSNNVFANNIVVLDHRVSTLVNIGPNTQPETFRFMNNLFYHTQNADLNRAALPGVQRGNLIQQPPRFEDFENGDYRPQETSPVIGAGAPFKAAIGDLPIPPPAVGDREGRCWRQPPSIGAFEIARQTGCIPWVLNDN